MRLHRGGQNIYHIGFEGTLTVRQGQSVDPYAAYLIYDSFTDTDGTHIHDHTPEKAPVGSVWFDADLEVGKWTISGNKAKLVSHSTETTVKIDSGAADVSVKVAAFTVGVYTALLARGTSGALNGILAYVFSTEDQIHIGKYDGGWTSLASAAYVNAPGDVLTNFELRCDGTAITVLIDGTQIVTTTSTFNQTQTHVGLLSYGDVAANGAADNFSAAAI